MNFRTIIAPFRIKSVESLKFTSLPDRQRALRAGSDDTFRPHAEDVRADHSVRAWTDTTSAR